MREEYQDGHRYASSIYEEVRYPRMTLDALPLNRQRATIEATSNTRKVRTMATKAEGFRITSLRQIDGYRYEDQALVDPQSPVEDMEEETRIVNEQGFYIEELAIGWGEYTHIIRTDYPEDPEGGLDLYYLAVVVNGQGRQS